MQITFAKNFFDPGLRTYKPGDVVEFPDGRALAMIHHGLAAAVADQTPAPIETTSGRRRKRETR